MIKDGSTRVMVTLDNDVLKAVDAICKDYRVHRSTVVQAYLGIAIRKVSIYPDPGLTIRNQASSAPYAARTRLEGSKYDG